MYNRSTNIRSTNFWLTNFRGSKFSVNEFLVKNFRSTNFRSTILWVAEFTSRRNHVVPKKWLIIRKNIQSIYPGRLSPYLSYFHYVKRRVGSAARLTKNHSAFHNLEIKFTTWETLFVSGINALPPSLSLYLSLSLSLSLWRLYTN
jgi:hypothetical protein